MKAQSRSYTCGAAAASNALECLGVRRTQAQLSRLGYVSPETGTDEEELKRMLLASEAAVDEWDFTMEALSKDWLRSHLTTRGPVIACMDNWEHYCTIIGFCGNRYVVFDPALGVGIRVYDWAGLKTRWCLSRAAAGPRYYAIGVSLPEAVR